MMVERPPPYTMSCVLTFQRWQNKFFVKLYFNILQFLQILLNALVWTQPAKCYMAKILGKVLKQISLPGSKAAPVLRVSKPLIMKNFQELFNLLRENDLIYSTFCSCDQLAQELIDSLTSMFQKSTSGSNAIPNLY